MKEKEVQKGTELLEYSLNASPDVLILLCEILQYTVMIFFKKLLW